MCVIGGSVLPQTSDLGVEASVLVVDDNPLIVNVLKSLLGSENYHVFTSADGQEALGVLDSKSIDVIVCDVMMPNMDGYQFFNSVRQKPEFSHIPFVFLTALADNTEVNKGHETGADDYIVKPFDPRALLSIIRGKVVRSKNLKNLSEEKYDKYRKKVIHTLSHEFRTPLVAINTGTELLMEQKHLDPSRVKNLVEAIRRGGQRLERLVTDFMLLQQIEAGIAQRMYDTRANPVVISTLVRSYIETNTSWFEAEGTIVTFVDHSQNARCAVYEPHILAILDRVVNNAIKFRKDDRSVEIHLYPEDCELVLEVRDRGIGIHVDQIKEAVDVFGQINREKLEQQGGGLGLAISSRYAAINRGHLDFENRKDGGAIISLVLPVSAK
jgi:two-component system sensor histidine kinase/response regulator